MWLDGFLEPLVGRKPEVPNLKYKDITDIQKETSEGNLAALPGAKKQAGQVDQFNYDQLAKALEFWAPGALQTIRDRVGSQVKGELSPETTKSLIRNATAVGYGKGFNFEAGGIGRHLVIGDLARGTEAQEQRGLTNLMSLYGQGPKPFDVTSMFFTPMQRLEREDYRTEQQFARNWLEEQISAAPSPMGQFIQNVVYAVAGVAGRNLGLAGGGGGGGSGTGEGGGGGGGFYTG